MIEYTLLIIKPDAEIAGIRDAILEMVYSTGLRACHTKPVHPGDAPWDDHYAEHVGKQFHPSLMEFVVSGIAVAVIVTGPDAVICLRNLIGAANPFKAAPSTIRGRLRRHAAGGASNLVHASDSPESAARELRLWFPEIDWDGVERRERGDLSRRRRD